MPRGYKPEFRQKVLDLLGEGRSIAELAESLGISEQTIYNWRNQDLIDRGEWAGRTSTESAELREARSRITELEAELAAMKRAHELLKEAVPPKVRFAIVGTMASEGHAVERACRILGVSCSGYYAWRSRAPSERAIRHAWLTDLITPVHIESRGTYGAMRVHAELTKGLGLQVGHNAVALLMRRADLSGPPGNKVRRCHGPAMPTASDLVDRNFVRQEPNQLWVTDITEHRTSEGKVYCCVVLDTFSRRVVGWSIDSSPTASLVTSALGMAIDSRLPNETLIHSDHGTQFTSWAFTKRAKDSGLVPSMGSIGDCFDNAMIESFWARMQVELLNRRRWRTRLELANAIFDYIEIFHNRKRRHSSLGMLTPVEYEMANDQHAEVA